MKAHALAVLAGLVALAVANACANEPVSATFQTDHDWTVKVGSATYGMRGFTATFGPEQGTNVLTEFLYGSPPAWIASTRFNDSVWWGDSKHSKTIRLPFYEAAGAALLPLMLLGFLAVFGIRQRFVKQRAGVIT